MGILLTTVVLNLVILIIGELSTCLIYGFFMKENDLKKYLDEREGNFELNPINPTIIRNKNLFLDLNFIATNAVPTLSVYYVNHMGRVWRWSESHKRIKKIHKELIEEAVQNDNNKKYKYETM